MVVYVTVPSAVERLTGERISVYPNPSAGKIVVTATSPILEIRAYTITGRLLREISTGRSAASLPVTLQQPQGIYLLEIRTAKGTVRKKIMIR